MIRVTAEDLGNGDKQSIDIWDDVCVITAGTAEVSSIQVHGNGTVQYTIKGIKNPMNHAGLGVSHE